MLIFSVNAFCDIYLIFFLTIFLAHFPFTECPPKWQLAVDIIAEIKVDYKTKLQRAASSDAVDYLTTSSMGRVLFIVRDSLALAQLRDVLVSGIAFVCDQRFRWFISQQAAAIRNRVFKQQQQQQTSNNFRKLSSSTNKRPATANGASTGSAAVTATGTVAATDNGHPNKQQRLGFEASKQAFLNPTDNDLLGEPELGKANS